jgi:hypothetical protein
MEVSMWPVMPPGKASSACMTTSTSAEPCSARALSTARSVPATVRIQCRRIAAQVHGGTAGGVVAMAQIGLVLDRDLEHTLHVADRAELPGLHDVEDAVEQGW